jgi:addiction module HigA family antidote
LIHSRGFPLGFALFGYGGPLSVACLIQAALERTGASGRGVFGVGVPRTRIERLVRQETAMTADTALRLARFFDVSPAFWMNIQTQYDLELAEDKAAAELAAITPHHHESA